MYTPTECLRRSTSQDAPPPHALTTRKVPREAISTSTWATTCVVGCQKVSCLVPVYVGYQKE